MKIVECVDKQGRVTFAAKCPAGTEKTADKRLRGLGGPSTEDEPSMEEIAATHPITLFAVENCEACDLVRNQLRARAIPFTELDVSADQANFNRLTEVTGGAATVPTLTVDETVLTGYNSASLDGALANAGYPTETR